MKRKIILFFALICGLNVYGQIAKGVQLHMDEFTVIDNAAIKVTYAFSRIQDVDRPEVRLEDTHVVLLGERTSRHYSKQLMDWAEDVYKNWAGKSVYPSHKLPSYRYDFYRNYPVAGTITVIDHGNILNYNYIYKDIVRFNWTMHGEFREILGRKCQKATATFRGRDWTAWFAIDTDVNNLYSTQGHWVLPKWPKTATGENDISGGPWKFSGLPGLILKVYDSENHYDWEATAIESTDEPIKFYNLNYTETTRMEFVDLMRDMAKDYAAFYTSRGIIIKSVGKGTITTSPPRPYNSIERD
jgi:GLPGLI family protein